MKLNSLRDLFMAAQGLQKREPAGHGRVWSNWRQTGVEEAVREQRIDPAQSAFVNVEANATGVEVECPKDLPATR